MRKYQLFLSFAILIIGISNCRSNSEKGVPKGKLVIIGGGKRPANLLDTIISLSHLRSGGYGVILPMSSSEPDSAYFYAREQFNNNGITNVYNLNFQRDSSVSRQKLDSLEKAAMIYIVGGDQNRFMAAVAGTPTYEAMHNAYENGSIIVGTSAGAAVMSKKMLTGVELKQGSKGDYNTIESKNIEIAEGLGFVTKVIIDQHFIKRKRLNRLLSVAIENPGDLSIGIDESTAILIEGNKATVVGSGQVITLNLRKATCEQQSGLLAAKNIVLNIYLPGETFQLPK